MSDPIVAPGAPAPASTDKPFWQSKTLWFNVIAGLNVVLSHFNLSPVGGDESAAILTIGNLILRLVTKGAVTIS